MAYCKRCNRPIEGRKRDHECDLVVLMHKKTEETKKVHADRVERGGDLAKAVSSKGDWEVVYRVRTKIEKLFEKEKKND